MKSYLIILSGILLLGTAFLLVNLNNFDAPPALIADNLEIGITANQSCSTSVDTGSDYSYAGVTVTLAAAYAYTTDPADLTSDGNFVHQATEDVFTRYNSSGESLDAVAPTIVDFACTSGEPEAALEAGALTLGWVTQVFGLLMASDPGSTDGIATNVTMTAATPAEGADLDDAITSGFDQDDSVWAAVGGRAPLATAVDDDLDAISSSIVITQAVP
jgi:hypothetical protein